jgi:hypothetical protein
MKVKVTDSHYIKDTEYYILIIKFTEGKKILPGFKMVEVEEGLLTFTVKSLTLFYSSDLGLLQIIIEKPEADLKLLEGKEFKHV